MEIEKKGGEGEGAAAAPVPDVFGTIRTADGKPVVEEPAKKEDKKEGEDKKPDEIEKNPVVVELRSQLKKLEEDKGSMGGNLSEQGKAIAKLKKELDDIKGGKKPTVEPMFKDIKRVKDLPAERQAEMSDTEKATFDSLAETQEKMNAMIADAGKKETDAAAAAAAAEEDEQTAEAFNGRVQSAVLVLVGAAEGKPTSEQKDMANAIIEEFNAFSGNDKLDAKGIADRLQKAAKLVPDYKPPKEQKSPTGGAAKAADGTGSSEIDKIVEDAKAKKGGGTYAL